MYEKEDAVSGELEGVIGELDEDRGKHAMYHRPSVPEEEIATFLEKFDSPTAAIKPTEKETTRGYVPLAAEETLPPPPTSSSPFPPSDDDQWKNVISARHVVFSGGGAKAIACWCTFNGTCEIIQQCCNGLEVFDNIRTFVGTSMGAIISLCAVGCKTRSQVTDIITRPGFWDGYDFARSFNVDNVLKHNALCDHSLSYRTLDNIMGELDLPPTIDFEHLWLLRGKDLICNAANITTEKSEVFSRTTTPNMRVRDAIACSMNVPVILPPMQRYENWYVDGGIYQNVLHDVTPELETIGFYLDWDPIDSAGWARLNFIQHHLSLIASCINAQQRLLLDRMTPEQKRRFIPVHISLPMHAGSLLISATPPEIQRLALDGAKAALSFMLAERVFTMVFDDTKMWDEFIARIPKTYLPTLGKIMNQDKQQSDQPVEQGKPCPPYQQQQHQPPSPAHPLGQQHPSAQQPQQHPLGQQPQQPQQHPMGQQPQQPPMGQQPHQHPSPVFVPVWYPSPPSLPYFAPPPAFHLSTPHLLFHGQPQPYTPCQGQPYFTHTASVEHAQTPGMPRSKQCQQPARRKPIVRRPPPPPVIASDEDDDEDDYDYDDDGGDDYDNDDYDSSDDANDRKVRINGVPVYSFKRTK